MKSIFTPARVARGLLVAVSCLYASNGARADMLFLSEYGANAIMYYNLANSSSGVFTTNNISGPEGIVADKNYNIYVSNIGNNTITKYSPGGTYLGTIATAASGIDDAEGGLAIDSAGNIYAGNYSNGKIIKIATNGTASVFANTGNTSIEGMVCDSSNNLYVVYYGGTAAFQIHKFNPAGTDLGTYCSVLTTDGQPVPIARDHSGNFYVGGFYASPPPSSPTIRKFSADGTTSNVLATLGTGTPGQYGTEGMTFDSSGTGTLYVSMLNFGTIREYDSTTGAYLGDLATGLSSPTFLTAIPEPSALLLAGAAGLAVLGWRRFRRRTG